MGYYRLLVYFCIALLLMGCQEGGSPTAAASLPTPHTTNTPSPTSPPIPTYTAIPTVTPSPTPTETMTPAPTATATATATATMTATPTFTATPLPLNRQCPETAPPKPDYQRQILGATVWPTPNAAAADPHFWLQRPLPGAGRFLITNWFPYGWDSYTYLLHNGVDVAEAQGTVLLAAADGTIITAGEDNNRLFGWRCDWYGNLVVIQLDHLWQDEPVFLLYGHVQNVMVQEGERVHRGQPVAEIGMGGAALLPHLHLEIRLGTNEFGSTRNPMLWFYPGDTRGVLAGRLMDPAGRPWQGVTIEAVGRSEDNRSDDPIRTWSYLDDPDSLINPDEGLAENFVFHDMRPGQYELFITVQGVQYRQMATVTAGAVSTVEIVTQAATANE